VTDQTEQLSTHLMLDYLVELGSELLAAGCPSYRLETLLSVVAAHEGFSADVFALPTGLFVAIRTPTGTAPAVSMVRVNEWRVDLQRLAVLDELLNRVVDRTLTVHDARLELRHASHEGLDQVRARRSLGRGRGRRHEGQRGRRRRPHLPRPCRGARAQGRRRPAPPGPPPRRRPRRCPSRARPASGRARAL
jgi:hypothetical protein